MFQPVVGFKASLTTKLLPEDAVLPLHPNDVARLAQRLPEANDYTRLWIGDGLAHEIVKVTGIIEGTLIIARGEEGTRAIASPAGACVSFVWTPANLADFIQQGMGGWQPAVCSVAAGSERVMVATENCAVTIDVPACAGDAAWRSGNQQFTQRADGCITTAPVSSPIADGEYVNATVTVRDGQIVAIKSGTNIVYSGGGCCCGHSESGA